MAQSSDSGGSSSRHEHGSSTPPWRVLFDAIERPVTRASEAWVNSSMFMDGLATTWKLQRRFNAELRRALETWFEAWQVPTRSDIDRLSNQIASLERQVRDLRGELDRGRASQSATVQPGHSAQHRDTAGNRR